MVVLSVLSTVSDHTVLSDEETRSLSSFSLRKKHFLKKKGDRRQANP
jgi:hypothetical protein